MRPSLLLTWQMRISRAGMLFIWVMMSALLHTVNNSTSKGQNCSRPLFVTEPISPVPQPVTAVCSSTKGAGNIRCLWPVTRIIAAADTKLNLCVHCWCEGPVHKSFYVSNSVQLWHKAKLLSFSKCQQSWACRLSYTIGEKHIIATDMLLSFPN